MRIATITKELSFFKPSYRVDAEGLSIAGDWWNMNFAVTRSGMPVARISQRWLSWADAYEVTIEDDSAELLIVALVVAIDTVKADEQAAKESNSTN